MDPILIAVLSICMRATHILAVTTLLGGVIFARITKSPVGSFASYFGWAAFLILISGIYNLVTKENIPPRYHLWFGIKMLFALHILAVSAMLARSSVSEEKKFRLMGGVAVTGLLTVILSAYLRFIANWMQI